MATPGFEELTRRFLAFAEPYKTGEPDDRANVRLKIDHTLRVTALAQTIAAESALPEPAARLSAVAALFHDTGRFPQYARWRTFQDAKSADHARLSLEALARGPLLDGLPRRERGVVLAAVRLHNRRALPSNLRPPLDHVARVVRDADKLDIMAVLLAHLDADAPRNNVVLLGLASDPARWTPACLDALARRRNVDYASMRYTNDFRLLMASWIYDLGYPASARLM
ncbi:MAG: HD domain-containing protein, partial [Desulfovibrionaceae bacterium]